MCGVPGEPPTALIPLALSSWGSKKQLKVPPVPAPPLPPLLDNWKPLSSGRRRSPSSAAEISHSCPESSKIRPNERCLCYGGWHCSVGLWRQMWPTDEPHICPGAFVCLSINTRPRTLIHVPSLMPASVFAVDVRGPLLLVVVPGSSCPYAGNSYIYLFSVPPVKQFRFSWTSVKVRWTVQMNVFTHCIKKKVFFFHFQTHRPWIWTGLTPDQAWNWQFSRSQCWESQNHSRIHLSVSESAPSHCLDLGS